MRSVLWAWVLCLMPMVVFAEEQAAADSPELRAAAAERYLGVADLPKMMDDLADGMVRTLPEKNRALFLSAMKEHLRTDMLESAMKATMTKHFTAAELNELADFYGSPTGKAALAKMPTLMAEMMPLMQAEVQRAVSAAQRELAEAAKAKPTGT